MSDQAPRAAPRSMWQIRTLAKKTRAVLGYEAAELVHMAELLELHLPVLLPEFVYDVQTMAEMGDDEGRACPDRDYIALREDVYEGVMGNNGRDRFTVAHELGHLILHQKENLVMARGSGPVQHLCDPEWQANTFAAEFLMDFDLCRGLSNEYEMTKIFGVSLAAARRRLKSLALESQTAELRHASVRGKKPHR